MKQRNAVYAGSFDPIHLGHLWVVEQGAKLFDHLWIVIGQNPFKTCMFSLEDRIDFVVKATKHIDNISICQLFEEELVVDFAYKNSCLYLLRGIRGSQDLVYESSLQFVNNQLHSDIQTVYLNTPTEYQYISSSIVRELLKLKKYYLLKEKYIPKGSFEEMIKVWEKKNEK
jgi:pantetheine-phosphate adenylyltransferase